MTSKPTSSAKSKQEAETLWGAAHEDTATRPTQSLIGKLHQSLVHHWLLAAVLGGRRNWRLAIGQPDAQLSCSCTHALHDMDVADGAAVRYLIG